mmetsp:Transcript_27258/g.38752  ORF Transcript_27258/g.38752 Transcript_27258/m.38752 type:complete len:80 (+) Transcript_27258:119-358(+)
MNHFQLKANKRAFQVVKDIEIHIDIKIELEFQFEEHKKDIFRHTIVSTHWASTRWEFSSAWMDAGSSGRWSPVCPHLAD